ncbi:penicillin-binding protein 1A [Piscinibacter sp.]|uniref:penicillin-binding protein 1A n=1 Tax=Piscinibacter sp. TaxID=1903157 RepID=UPI002F40C1FD
MHKHDNDGARRVRRGLHIALAAAGVAVVLLAVYVGVLVQSTPSIEDLRSLQAAQPSVLLSADGQTLMTFRRAQQERVPLARISPHVVQALIATEDHRFYDHPGVDVRRSLSALFHTVSGETQGGSTITQQLARNQFPDEIGRSRTIDRKLREIITALRIERLYGKPQILENYLNTAPFLYNVIGIEMAARTYYDKPAAELDLLESATLIGMLKGSAYYSPINHPERAQTRRNVVLSQMVRRHWLSAAQLQQLREQPLQLHFNRQSDGGGTAPHFAAQVRKWLIEWADEHDYNLYTDGLVVKTTLDSRLQEAATRAVERQTRALQQIADVEWSKPALPPTQGGPEAYAKRHAKLDPFGFFWSQRRELLAESIRDTPEFKKAVHDGASEAAALQRLATDAGVIARLKRDKTRLEAGFLAIDPATGEVKAWVGSRDFDVDQYDHVAQAERQPGSTFKPFVYGAALEAGLSPDRSYVDAPVEIPLGDGKVWRPSDMTAPSGETLTLRDGLVYSKNTITAQVMRDIGVARIVAFARAMGVDQSKLDPVPSLALGTSPVTLLEMVNGYASIARLGQVHKPLLVKRISDRRGRTLAEFAAETRLAMSADSAVELIDMMRGVVSRGTGTQVKTRFGLLADIAGKTGTTQNNTDGWFILMHPNLVAGAWVGFNDARVTMRSDYWGQGGHNAILLVGDFFRSVLQQRWVDVAASFPPPRRPAPEAPAASEPADSWSQQIEGLVRTNPPPDADAQRDSQPPKSAEELGQVMRGMGRDPVTGVPRDEPSAAASQPP